jgi:hypothetical protein
MPWAETHGREGKNNTRARLQIGGLNNGSVGLGSKRVVGIAAGLWYHLAKERAVRAEQ